MIDRKRSQSQCIRRQRTIPEIRYTIFLFLIHLNFLSSEYTDRYVPHRSEAYLSSRRLDIPRIYTTVGDLNRNLSYRSVSNLTRQPPVTPDPMEIDHITSPRRNANIPRANFYLGSLPDHMNRRMKKKLPNLTESTSLVSPLTASTEQFPSQEQIISVE